MKNRKVSITKEQLNSGDVIEIDSTLAVSGNYDISNSIEVKILYPNFVFLENSSGIDLFWNTVSNDREYNDYLSFPEQFVLIPLKNSKTLQSIDRTPRCYKFLLQKNPSSGNAISDIDIYFINYN